VSNGHAIERRFFSAFSASHLDMVAPGAGSMVPQVGMPAEAISRLPAYTTTHHNGLHSSRTRTMAIFSIPSFMAIASTVLKPIPRTSRVSSIRVLGHDHGVRAIGLEDAQVFEKRLHY
jgi:hypothetical protein